MIKYLYPLFVLTFLSPLCSHSQIIPIKSGIWTSTENIFQTKDTILLSKSNYFFTSNPLDSVFYELDLNNKQHSFYEQITRIDTNPVFKSTLSSFILSATWREDTTKQQLVFRTYSNELFIFKICNRDSTSLQLLKQNNYDYCSQIQKLFYGIPLESHVDTISKYIRTNTHLFTNKKSLTSELVQKYQADSAEINYSYDEYPIYSFDGHDIDTSIINEVRLRSDFIRIMYSKKQKKEAKAVYNDLKKHIFNIAESRSKTYGYWFNLNYECTSRPFIKGTKTTFETSFNNYLFDHVLLTLKEYKINHVNDIKYEVILSYNRARKFTYWKEW